MHREIQINQFPIVTTHWWPKTRNERFVWENEQYLYRFYLLYTTMSKWSECSTHIRCVTCVLCVCVTCVCARALAHAAFTRGVVVNAWRRACLKRGADATFQASTEASANQIASCKYPIPFMQHQRSMWLVVVTMTARQHHASDTPSVKRWRRRARARAHTRHTHTSQTHTHTHVTHTHVTHTHVTHTHTHTQTSHTHTHVTHTHTHVSHTHTHTRHTHTHVTHRMCAHSDHLDMVVYKR